jgi:hypothetical protein
LIPDEYDTLQAALNKFQKDKGLPVGNLNIPSLKVLGVLK